MSFLRNCWYGAAWAHEVGETPLARRLLGQHVVLYRTADGEAHALHDRCPHRFAPLSMGRLIDDQLQCPYHGLRFGTDGSCTYNPHYAALPKAAKVTRYPLLERYGMLWIWMGKAPANPRRLADDFVFLEDHRFQAVRGYLHVEANYQLVVDNLLDLTHAPYLHSAFAIPGMSTEQRLRATSSELERTPERVIAKRWRMQCPPSAPNRELFGFADEPINARSHMHWMPPSLIYFDAGAWRLNESEEQGLCLPAMHVITPETELTSHYFFAQARNKRLDDQEAEQGLRSMLENAFRNEDEPMIEAQQARMGTETDLLSLNPVLLKSDGAPVAARRALARLIEAEQAC